jgi:hypothetical protein
MRYSNWKLGFQLETVKKKVRFHVIKATREIKYFLRCFKYWFGNWPNVNRSKVYWPIVNQAKVPWLVVNWLKIDWTKVNLPKVNKPKVSLPKIIPTSGVYDLPLLALLEKVVKQLSTLKYDPVGIFSPKKAHSLFLNGPS